MKNTIVVISSNRGLEKQTKASLAAMQAAGAMALMETGSADVAFARNRALSWACNKLRDFPERDSILMMDDDMEVPLETGQALLDKARALQRPTAAVYSTLHARIAAARWPEKPGWWLCGLGIVAIPRALLLELEERSESYEQLGTYYTAFCWTGPYQGGWIAEDFRLSMNLGGVHLMPLGVGHIKKGALWPDDETLANIAKDGEPPQ
jgi:hypothetical protein